jgi:hypothetical protein
VGPSRKLGDPLQPCPHSPCRYPECCHHHPPCEVHRPALINLQGQQQLVDGSITMYSILQRCELHLTHLQLLPRCKLSQAAAGRRDVTSVNHPLAFTIIPDNTHHNRPAHKFNLSSTTVTVTACWKLLVQKQQMHTPCS